MTISLFFASGTIQLLDFDVAGGEQVYVLPLILIPTYGFLLLLLSRLILLKTHLPPLSLNHSTRYIIHIP